MPEMLRSTNLAVLGTLVLLCFLMLTAVSSAIGFLAEKLAAHRRIYAVPLAPGQYRFELYGNVIFLAVATVSFTLVLSNDWIIFGEETIPRFILTFSAQLVGFQVYYWLLHRAMHTKLLIRIHAWHHRSHVTTPLSGQSMSFSESCLWMVGYVGLPLLFSQLAPMSFWGWIAYIVFNVSGNVVGHANVELGTKRTATRLVALAANPFVYHALHHARWRGHYGFQAALMDRLFGTEFQDWPEMFARIDQGKPLQSLKERA